MDIKDKNTNHPIGTILTNSTHYYHAIVIDNCRGVIDQYGNKYIYEGGLDKVDNPEPYDYRNFAITLISNLKELSKIFLQLLFEGDIEILDYGIDGNVFTMKYNVLRPDGSYKLEKFESPLIFLDSVGNEHGVFINKRNKDGV